MNEKDPRPVSEAISELISLRGIARYQGNAELHAAWKDVSGKKFASQTRVLGLKRGVLQVGVTNAPAMGELASFHKASFLNELKKNYPDLKIRDLKFSLKTDHRNRKS